MPVCESCGREVPDGAHFCGNCGASTASPEAGVGSAADSATAYWKCASCGVESPPDAAFCDSCGAARPDSLADTLAVPVPTVIAAAVVPPTPVAARASIMRPRGAQWECVTCGEVNDPDSRFCYYCGVARAARTALKADSPPVMGHDAGGVPSPPEAYGSATPTASRGSRGRWVVVTAALIAVAVVCAAAVIVLWPPPPPPPHDDASSPTPTGRTTPPTPSSEPGAANQPALQAFLSDIETLIEQAGQGKHDIGAATVGIRSGELSSGEAAGLVDSVIANRQDVLSQLRHLSVPADQDAAAALQAFKNAMRYSIEVDYKYLDWVRGSGSEPTVADNASADEWKHRFISAYNPLARSLNMRDDWEAGNL